MSSKSIESSEIMQHIDDMQVRESLLRTDILKLQVQVDTIHQERIKLTVSLKQHLED